MNKTGIEYLDYTWNPLAMRCTPDLSPGCANCWHLAFAKRHAGNSHFSDAVREAYRGGEPVLREKELLEPLRRKDPAVIGVQFMGDLFHEKVFFDLVDQVFAVMTLSPQHRYMLLTKRPERMKEWFAHTKREKVGWWQGTIGYLSTKLPGCPEGVSLPEPYGSAWKATREHYFPNADPTKLGDMSLVAHWPPSNLTIGASASTQADLDRVEPPLLECPAACRVLSLEPLLGPIVPPSLGYTGPQTMVDGVIVGGESGKVEGIRPMHPDWVRSIRDQCAAAGVPFYFKQWGEWLSECQLGDGKLQSHDMLHYKVLGGRLDGQVFLAGYTSDRTAFIRVGTAKAGRLLDGKEHNELPEGLKL